MIKQIEQTLVSLLNEVERARKQIQDALNALEQARRETQDLLGYNPSDEEQEGLPAPRLPGGRRGRPPKGEEPTLAIEPSVVEVNGEW